MTLATQTLYDWLLFLHVLAAMVWVGGGVMLAAVAARVLRDPDPAAVGRFTASLRSLGPLVLAPATVAVLGLGIGLVVDRDAWDFGQLWLQRGRARQQRRSAAATAPLVVGLPADRPAARRRRLGHDHQTGTVKRGRHER